MPELPQSAYTIQSMHEAFTKARFEVWLTDNLGHWQWWLLLGALLLPWLVWWRLADRRRLSEILLFGMSILVTSSLMDQLGSELLCWYYPFQLIPWYPQLVPTNYSVLPVTYMLVYQHFTTWRSYMVAISVIAAIFTWVAEPALCYIGIYKLIDWQYSYSFPLYLLIAISHRWFVTKVIEVTRRHNKYR